MPRPSASVLILSLLLLAWLWMQGVHELGHVACAWLTGGTVERVVWHPLAISRTDLGHNPQPLLVAWAGPVIGSLLPLAIWGLAAAFRLPLAWIARFFAGFCLLANGLYIGVGSLDGIGDAGDLLRHGTPLWSLWLFGALAAPLGLALRNGLGAKMGLGKSGEPFAWQLVSWSLAALVLTSLALFILFPSAP